MDRAILDIRILLNDIIETNDTLSKEEKLDSIRSLSNLVGISSQKMSKILEDLSNRDVM